MKVLKVVTLLKHEQQKAFQTLVHTQKALSDDNTEQNWYLTDSQILPNFMSEIGLHLLDYLKELQN